MRFKKLGEIANIQIGKTPKREVKAYWGEGYPWVSISDLKEKVIYKTKEEITELAVIESGCKLIPKGTLLLSFKLSIGKLAFAGTDLYTNEAICGLKIIDESKVWSEYLFYALKAIRFLGSNAAVMGATLNTASLNALKIPLPDKDEQIRIATILGRAEQLITQRKAGIELLDDFLKSSFKGMFGDILNGKEQEPLGSGLNLLAGFAFKSSDFKDQGIPIIKIGTVNKGYFDLSTLSFLPESDIYKKFEICPGELLLTLTGTVGKDDYANTCFATNDYNKYYLNQRVAKIKVNPAKLNLQFIHYLFQFPPFKNRLIKSDKGVRQANLSNDEVHNSKINYPDISRQNHFAEIVNNTVVLKSQLQNSLQELENLYGSLSQKAFKGELDLSKLAVEYDESKQTDENKPAPQIKDVTEMSLDDFYNIPEEIQQVYGSIEQHVFDWEFFFKKHFADRPITTEEAQKLYHSYNYERGYDFDYEEFAHILFETLKKENTYLHQEFNPLSKQIEITVKNEASQA